MHINTQNTKNKKKEFALAILACINGILFFSIAASGIHSIEKTTKTNNNKVHYFLFAASIISALNYSAFFYETLKTIRLKPKNKIEFLLWIPAIFSASSYLSSGIKGSEKLNYPQWACDSSGALLFLLRAIACIDSANRFPNQLNDIKNAVKQASAKQEYSEIVRLSASMLIATAYALASTDATYLSTEWLLKKTHATQNNQFHQYFCFIATGLGSLGTLMLALYWTYRGIKQATYSEKEISKETADPSDRHTLYASLIATITSVGAIGAASNSHPVAFAKLGETIDRCVNLPSSILYSVFGSIPGIAPISRKWGLFLEKSCSKQNETTNNTTSNSEPLLATA